MIAIIDYGMGNLRSVEKAVHSLGANCSILSSPPAVGPYSGAILPGVGAFGEAIRTLKGQGWIDWIQEVVTAAIPFLGVCLGLQLLFTRSEEGGDYRGLGLIPGKVIKLPPSLRVPHMGWNQLSLKKKTPLFTGISEGDYVYFVHSYHAVPDDKSVIIATTDYGGEVVAAVESGNIFGLQFHPEKSQTVGLKILRNFLDVVERSRTHTEFRAAQNSKFQAPNFK